MAHELKPQGCNFEYQKEFPNKWITWFIGQYRLEISI